MICAIMQPTFLPWIGYFDMIDQVDKFIFLDHVQLQKQSWQTRNRIKINDKESFINVQITKTASHKETLICNTVIDASGLWRKKLLKTIF